MGPYLNPSEVVGIIYKHLTRRGDEGLPVTVPVPSLDNNELGPPLRPVCAILYPKIYPLDWTHPNYGDASYVPFDDGWVLFSISIVTCIMLGIAVITRLVTRHLFAGRLGPDDWMIVVALVLAIGNTIINCRGVVVGGLGLYMHDMTLTHFIHAYKLAFCHQLFYSGTSVAIKTSILLFYRRLVGPHRIKMQRVIIILMVVNILFRTGLTLQLTFSCRPMRARWDVLYQIQHQNPCGFLLGNGHAYYALAPCHVMLDLFILLLPARVVMRLRTSKRQKKALVVLFVFAVFACVACGMRVVALGRLRSKRTTRRHFYRNVFLWSQAEITLGCIAACAPGIIPLFTRLIPRWQERYCHRRRPDTDMGRGAAGHGSKEDPLVWNQGNRTIGGSPMNDGNISGSDSFLDSQVQIEMQNQGRRPISKKISHQTRRPEQEHGDEEEESRECDLEESRMPRSPRAEKLGRIEVSIGEIHVQSAAGKSSKTNQHELDGRSGSSSSSSSSSICSSDFQHSTQHLHIRPITPPPPPPPPPPLDPLPAFPLYVYTRR